MARILITYWRSDEISANATLNFWDGLFQEFCNSGNDILAINNSFYNIWISNKTDVPTVNDYIHKEVELFNPELIIAFNNRILQSIVDKYKDIPIVLYDGDELKFFSDLDTIKKNISRYKVFSIVNGWRQDYLDFGFKENQIFYMPPGTAICSDSSVKQTKNISLLGQRRFYLNDLVLKRIKEDKDCDYFYKAYLEHIRTGSFNYKELFLNNGGKNSDVKYSDSDLWPIFDDSYLLLANLLDLGLYIGGHEGHWRDIVDYIPQLAVAHNLSRVFTLEENQTFYNSSVLSLNPMHPQARGKGFSWRSFDIMASNACLVSSYSSELADLTKSTVKIPMFASPSEARYICQNLLEHKELRDEIVNASHEYVKNNCRWPKRFKEMEEILGIKLLFENKKGSFKKLDYIVPEEYFENSNKYIDYNFKKTNNSNIVYVDNYIKQNSLKLILKTLWSLYGKFSDKVKNASFLRIEMFLIISLYILRVILNIYIPENLIASKIILFIIGMLAVFGLFCLFMAILYKPIRTILKIFYKILKKIKN